MKSHDGVLRFAAFTLDPANRRLLKDDTPVEIGGRYFDALLLLVRERGQLVSKDRLHDEVWHGVPVTDEALSQAIMALRKALGDDAVRPRFIETVPRHGYRFIADLAVPAMGPPVANPVANERLRIVAGGVIGAAGAGIAVGILYGAIAASGGAGSALSLLLVVTCVSVLAALVSGLGIAGGIGWIVRPGSGARWRAVIGGMIGGVVVGGLARLLGLDTLRLLTGSAPDRIAGAGEGLVMGLAAGTSYVLAGWRGRLRHAIAPALGGLGGAAIVVSGGTLMAGSLAALVSRFPGAGLSMEWASDPLLLALSGALEGALFIGLVVWGMHDARHR